MNPRAAVVIFQTIFNRISKKKRGFGRLRVLKPADRGEMGGEMYWWGCVWTVSSGHVRFCKRLRLHPPEHVGIFQRIERGTAEIESRIELDHRSELDFE